MKLIELSQGHYTKVDDSDYDMLNKFRWTLWGNKRYLYAKTYFKINGKWKTIFMHRLILGLTDKKYIADHINHDGLDNRRINLRKSDYILNGYNRNRNYKRKGEYKGVFWHKRHNSWMAQIVVNKKQKYLGYYQDKIEAAKVYDIAAIKYHGEYANTNF